MIALDKDSEKSFDGESFIVMTSFFGGLNIHIQIKSIITNTSLKYKYFILGRLLQILFATILFLLSYFIY